MSRPIPAACKTRNWRAYNEALKRRSSLTIWLDPAMTREAAPTGKRGRQPDYSDAAIQTCLTMKVLFGMALVQIARARLNWSKVAVRTSPSRAPVSMQNRMIEAPR